MCAAGRRPAHLLLGRGRDQPGREHPAEPGVGARRAPPGQLNQGLEQLPVFRRSDRRCVRGAECEPGHTVRVLHRVHDRDRPALRHTQQGEALQARGIDASLQVPYPRLQRQVIHVPVRQPIAALVTSDDSRDLTKVLHEVTPHRALPVVLQMAQPTGVHHQRWSAAVDARAILTPSGARQERSSCASPPRRADLPRRAMSQGYAQRPPTRRTFMGNRPQQAYEIKK